MASLGPKTGDLMLRLEAKTWRQDLMPRIDAKTWCQDLIPRLSTKTWRQGFPDWAGAHTGTSQTRRGFPNQEAILSLGCQDLGVVPILGLENEIDKLVYLYILEISIENQS